MNKNPGGKGSSPRPFSVDQKTFDNNWDQIFGNKSKKDFETTNKNENSTHSEVKNNS